MGCAVSVPKYLEMVVLEDKDQAKEIVAEKVVGQEVDYCDQVQVCVCLDVVDVEDHPAALDHQVHHCSHLVGLHQVSKVVDACHYQDP